MTGWRGTAAPGRFTSARLLVIYRSLLVACAITTLAMTWDLWRVRVTPPMLPVLSLPRVDMGVPLVVALLAVLATPIWGAAAFGVLLFYAILIDQTRIQPEFVSLALLLVGASAGSAARFVGRAHLITMWGWAGINKILSPAFLASTAPALLAGVWPGAPPGLKSNAGYMAALAEVAIAVLALAPRARWAAATVALGLHAGILLVLSPRADPNIVVWPWNIALALAGLVFIAPWKGSVSEAFRASRLVPRFVVAALLVMPAGFYFGVVDAYLSHNLYSSNTPLATTVPPTRRLFRVPFPPEHRLFEQHFQLTCYKGQTLQILDRRWWFMRRGLANRTVVCEFHPRSLIRTGGTRPPPPA